MNNTNEEQIKKALEQKGIEQSRNLLKNNKLNNDEKINEAIHIMKQGADAFVKETGRQLSYGEMRELYG